MTNIAQHLPKQSKVTKAIFAHYKKVGDAEPVRGYLGASIIGHPCERYLWYCFRQCCKPNFSGRMYRLFQTGDWEEARLTKDLQAIGCEVHQWDGNSKQFAVSAFGGHFSGHMDGCVLGIPEAPKTWHVLEFKTHNTKSFRDLTKNGVKKSKPQHYAQMMVYMHLSGMKRALYLARWKDTDDLYSERIRYDETEAEALMERAKRIIKATSPPDRISGREDYFQCNWCDARAICWGSRNTQDPALPLPVLSCRQCCHATPLTDILGDYAEWRCEKLSRRCGNCNLPCTPCDKHLILPGLIAFAEPSNAGDDFIEFTNNDGTGTWKHGKDGFSSEELTKLPVNLLLNEMIKSTKDLFGAIITGHDVDILQRYPRGDSRIVWEGPAVDLASAWKAEYNEDLLSLEPIARNIENDYSVVELEGDRIAIIYRKTVTAEICEGKE